MKILGLYAFRDPKAWCTPNSILNCFERMGHNVQRVSLFDDKGEYYDYNLYKYVKLEYSIHQPDMVLFFDYGRFDSEWLHKKHFPNSFVCFEQGDEPQNFHRNVTKSHKCHLLHTPDYDSYLKYKAAGLNVLWLPHWADGSLYDLPLIKDNFPPVRSSRGPGSSLVLDSLSALMPDKFINKSGMSGEEHTSYLRNAQIVVQHSRHHEYTRRIPEAMLAGALVITDRLPPSTNIDSMFVENEDIVYYDSVQELISKINYYLSDRGKYEARDIAYSGFIKTVSEHTSKHRSNSILKAYEEWKSTKV